MKKILAIAFDLEGPIIDVEMAHHQGHILTASDVGVNLNVEECFQKIPKLVQWSSKGHRRWFFPCRKFRGSHG